MLPEQDAVVVTTAETETMQTILDAVWAHLVPAFDSQSATGDDARLAARLASLALPAEGAGTVDGDDWVTARAVTEQSDGWSGRTDALSRCRPSARMGSAAATGNGGEPPYRSGTGWGW